MIQLPIAEFPAVSISSASSKEPLININDATLALQFDCNPNNNVLFARVPIVTSTSTLEELAVTTVPINEFDPVRGESCTTVSP